MHTLYMYAYLHGIYNNIIVLVGIVQPQKVDSFRCDKEQVGKTSEKLCLSRKLKRSPCI